MSWTNAETLKDFLLPILLEVIRLQGRKPLDRLSFVQVDGLGDRVVHDGPAAIHGHLKPPLAAPERRAFVHVRAPVLPFLVTS